MFEIGNIPRLSAQSSRAPVPPATPGPEERGQPFGPWIRLAFVAGARRARDPRLISRCRAELDVPAGIAEAETEDISARGLYLRTEALLPIGASTEIRVTLPDGTYLALGARVAHVLTAAAARAVGRHPGMGFAFVGPETPSRMKLRAFLEGLRVEITNPGLVRSASAYVIVVEPGAPMRARVAGALEAAGFQVTAVASAPEALQADGGWQPDAVIAAADMDGMTGTDLAYAMSEHPVLGGVPLVLIGEEGDLGRLEAFRAGVRDYIPRPFLDEELVIRIHRITAPAQAAGGGLRGSLLDIGLGTLLSLLEFERKSGILIVARTNELVRVLVSDGRLLKVEGGLGEGTGTGAGNGTGAGAAAGRERVMRLLDWRDGQFEFSPSASITGRDEIGISIATLLLEHARQRDEQSRPIVQRRS